MTATLESPGVIEAEHFITEAQADALARLVERFDDLPLAVSSMFLFDDTLMVRFPFMVIGIETDGYTHS